MPLKVKHKTSGQVGTIPDDKFDAGQFEIVQDTSQPQERTPSGFFSNIIKSGTQAVGDTLGAVANIANPDMEKNTVANVAKTGLGAAQLLVPGEQGQENRARAVGKFYDDRYGFSDVVNGDFESAGAKIADTVYNDPVGFALDTSSLLTGGGAVAKGAGAVSKSSTLSKVGRGLTAAGDAIDPLMQAGKFVAPKASGLKAGTADKLTDAGSRLESKALKLAPTDFKDFKSLTDTDIEDFVKQYELYGDSDAVASKIDTLKENYQTAYNEKVRTGKGLDVGEFVNRLNKRIESITTNDYSTGASKVKEELIKMREEFVNRALNDSIEAGSDTVKATDTTFTNTKGSSFSGVTKKDMTNPAAKDADKILGAEILAYLDEASPGSAALGKELQKLYQFEESVLKRAPKGLGAQLFNLFKPSGGGAVLGGMIGSAFGNPVAGMAIGGAATTVANNSKVQGAVARGLDTVGDTLQATDISQPIAAVERVGRVGASTTPDNQPQPEQPQAAEQINHTPTVPQGSQGQYVTSPDGSYKQDTTTGDILSSDGQWQWDNQAQDWMPIQEVQDGQSGELPTKDQVLQGMWEDMQATGGKKQAEYKKVLDFLELVEKNKSSDQNMVNGVIDQMETLYGTGSDDSLSIGEQNVGISGLFNRGAQTTKKLNNQDYFDRLQRYNNMRALAIGIINQARQAGVLNSGEYEQLAANMPNEYTTEKVANQWFTDAKQLLNKQKVNQQPEQGFFLSN